MTMMTEASCSILYPPGPVQLSGPEMEAWLDDLESILFPLPSEKTLEDNRKFNQSPLINQLGSDSQEYCNQSPLFWPLENEVSGSLVSNSGNVAQQHNELCDLCPAGQSAEICDLFPIDDVEIDGKLWESDPNAEQEEQQQQQQQGVESLSEPDSASSCFLPTAEKCQDSLSKCGAKRRRTGGSGGGKVSRPAKQTDSENLVQELIEENKRLKDQIEHLAAEVQRVRRELIEKVVASS